MMLERLDLDPSLLPSTLTVQFDVVGVPAPQGSKSVTKTGRMYEASSKALTPWRKAVRAAAEEAVRGLPCAPFGVQVPVVVEIEFRMPRPKTVRREWPAVTPDVDKLTRAVLDCLTKRVFVDDAQVVRTVAEKRYADDVPSGARVVVREIERSA